MSRYRIYKIDLPGVKKPWIIWDRQGGPWHRGNLGGKYRTFEEAREAFQVESDLMLIDS